MIWRRPRKKVLAGPEIRFLSIEEVIEIHNDLVLASGGEPKLLDCGLLDAAVECPKHSFEGNFLHVDLYEMAAAYLFHIVENHPFLDGNKRAGLEASLDFLNINGIQLSVRPSRMLRLPIRVAQKKLTKAEVAEFFRNHDKNKVKSG